MICSRTEDETGDFEMKDRRVEITYLFPRLAWPVDGKYHRVLVMIDTKGWGKEGQASPMSCYLEPTSDVNWSNPTY